MRLKPGFSRVVGLDEEEFAPRAFGPTWVKGMMMHVDERIRYLLRVAARAEGEGDVRIARIFRRVADEARPVEGATLIPTLHPAFGYGSE